MALSKPCTRENTVFFPFESLITHGDKIIKGSKLPSYSQILRCLFAYKENIKKWKYPAALKVVKQVKEHYLKSNVKMMKDERCAEKIVYYFEHNVKVTQRINTIRRDKEPHKSRIANFRSLINDNTMSLWMPDAYDLLDNEEERGFFNPMNLWTNRVATYVGRDIKTAKILQKRLHREEKRKQCEDKMRNSDSFQTITYSSDSSNKELQPPVVTSAVSQPTENRASFSGSIDSCTPKRTKKEDTIVISILRITF